MNPAIARLRRFNLIAGLLHTAQAAAVLAMSNDFSLPITATYMSGPPGTTYSSPVVVLNSRIGWGVGLFLAMSAIAHFVVIAPKFWDRYSAGLAARHNYFRWVEYSLSSSVMIVLIAQICGATDATALIGIFGVNASMIFFGWVQEKYEQPGSGGMVPFRFGCIAGSVPWLAVLFLITAPGNPSDASPPAFVYGIVFSIFALFNSFAWVQWKQYKATGKWADYLHGERIYIVLSLVAKSLLAWQVFANTLIPTS